MIPAVERLSHIKAAIAVIRDGLFATSVETLQAHPILSSGFRYQLLVISEAARHIPDEWKKDFGPDIGWRQLEDIGNRLRHGYHSVNLAILWNIYENDLDPLEAAIDAMLAAHGGGDSA